MVIFVNLFQDATNIEIIVHQEITPNHSSDKQHYDFVGDLI